MYAVAWLELGQPAQAAKLFGQSFQSNVQPPFSVWTETTAASGYGTPNFITGAGAFLQALLNGYGGARLRSGTLGFAPQLPPDVDAVSFSRLSYLGAVLTVSYNASSCVVTLHSPGAVPLAVQTAGQNYPLSTATPTVLLEARAGVLPAFELQSTALGRS
jgi:trehalose/maltose hydrolase-like predicted phosphorylase